MTTEYTTYAGDLTTQSIEEIWNSDYMKTIRKQMLNGEEPKSCSKCFESERSSNYSSRLNHNRYFKTKLQQIPVITKADGYVDDVDLRYWDFRFSNLCNLKCRSCGPEFSSSWIPDAEKLGWVNDTEQRKVFTINAEDRNTNVDFLKKYINKVEKIYFAGGEPLLMDEHWQILKMLDDAGRHDVILTYNTNLSKLTYQNQSVLDYWKKWGKRVWLWPSIDEIDERAELVRSGTNWKLLEENLKAVSNLNIHIKPGITVSCLNVHRIPEIINRLVDLKVINQHDENWCNFSINIVEYAEWYHVSVLPDAQRLEIKQKLENFIAQYNHNHGVDIKPIFLHLFWHLDKPHNVNMMNRFKHVTNKLDEIRGEKTAEIIPELKSILS